MKDLGTEAYKEDGDQPQSSLQCDAEIQVTPDRNNSRVQTSTKMKTIGECTQQEFSYNLWHYLYVYNVQRVKFIPCMEGHSQPNLP